MRVDIADFRKFQIVKANIPWKAMTVTDSPGF